MRNGGDSVVYRTHLDNVCRLIQKTIPQQQGTALEVGCGTGEFLRVLEPCVGQQLSLLGVDPSVQPHQDGRIRFDSYLFDKAHLPQIPSDLVLLISRHMIEHVVNPLEMLRLFACALPDNGVLYLETPRLDWILERGAFFDFGYEHCAYFTDDFMRRLLAAAGFQILAWKTSYQNQYFSIFATRCPSTPCGAGAILRLHHTMSFCGHRRGSPALRRHTNMRKRILFLRQTYVFGAVRKKGSFGSISSTGKARFV